MFQHLLFPVILWQYVILTCDPAWLCLGAARLELDDFPHCNLHRMSNWRGPTPKTKRLDQSVTSANIQAPMSRYV
jgi:hypothetical protein